MKSHGPPPDLDPAKFPNLAGIERPFFEYWWTHLVQPDEPHKLKWVAYEEEQPLLVRAHVTELGKCLPLKGAKVLDVGCQNGATLVALASAGAEPWGIELDAKAARAAELRLRCHRLEANIRAESACKMSFADGQFDGVIASNVIEHVTDPAALVRECARVLRPNGILYLDGPNRFSAKWLWSDPHYQMAGVSILPGRLSKFYATRVRRLPRYDAETFPTASWTRRQLQAVGFSLRHESDPRSQSWRANLIAMFRFLAERKASPPS